MSHVPRSWVAHLCAFGMAAGALVLFCFPPEQSSFYPRCLFFSWLHIYCPGCGGTRALAALVHGRLGEAFHWNGMLVLLLPFLLGFLCLTYWRAIRKAEFAWPVVPGVWVKLCLVMVVVFTVARNLHWQ